MTTAGYTINSSDLRTAPDEFFGALHTLETAFELESRPDEQPTPAEAFSARYRSAPGYRDATAWLVREGGAAVANAIAEWDRTGDNDHIVEAFVIVAPSRRGQGLARRLLAEVVDMADAERRSLLLGFTAASVPSGAAFMQRLGASPGLVERESELDLGKVDRSLIDRWLEEGPGRAVDYELVVIEDELPDELLGPFAALHDVTNTAPRDALEVADSHRTPEQIRSAEHSRRESGNERILCLARHRSSSELAGWTELGRHPSEPWKVQQYWTAVHPDHRGHALGKWLKAANVARARERWPEAKKIVTGNAYSNDAMLGINNEMGFEETIAWTVWQVPVADVRGYVSRA